MCNFSLSCVELTAQRTTGCGGRRLANGKWRMGIAGPNWDEHCVNNGYDGQIRNSGAIEETEIHDQGKEQPPRKSRTSIVDKRWH